MAEQRLAFRSAILPLYLITLLITIVVSVGSILFRHGLSVDWAPVGVRFLWAAVGVFVFIVAAVVLFRVYVSAEGLRCYSFWGNYHNLSWPEIDSVRPINLLGLRYLRVGSSQSGRTVWVPLFLADMPRFRAAVHEFAGEGHILVNALTMNPFIGMTPVPQIDRDAIVAAISRRLPSAIVSVKTVNPEYDSWIIDVRESDRLVTVSWGPLSGFGATDHQALREDGNPFAAYDWPLETVDQAVDFVVERLLVNPA